MKHVAPDVGVVQQGVHLFGAQRFHAFVHSFIQGDLCVWIELLDGLGTASQRTQHANAQIFKGWKILVAYGYEGEWRLDQVVRNNARVA